MIGGTYPVPSTNVIHHDPAYAAFACLRILTPESRQRRGHQLDANSIICIKGEVVLPNDAATAAALHSTSATSNDTLSQPQILRLADLDKSRTAISSHKTSTPSILFLQVMETSGVWPPSSSSSSPQDHVQAAQQTPPERSSSSAPQAAMSLRMLLGSTGGTAMRAVVIRMVSGWEHCGEASVVLGGGKGENGPEIGSIAGRLREEGKVAERMGAYVAYESVVAIRGPRFIIVDKLRVID